MKKLGARLAVLGVFLMIAAGCGSPVDKLELGMTEQEVISLLGEPKSRVPPDNYGRSRFIYYDVEDLDINIWFKGGKVSDVRTTEARPGSPYSR